MFFACEVGAYAVAAISLFCYAFQLKDSFGYAMDGVTTIVCVATAIFVLFVNENNKKECIRMHS
jgi:hypothetical protein